MFEDVRKYLEAALENLSAAKAQQLARQLLEPDARKDQVAKTAQDLLDWSQRNRERVKDFVSRELREQLTGMGVATSSEIDTLKRRVRELERRAGMTASGRKKTASTGKSTSRSRAATKSRAAAKTRTAETRTARTGGAKTRTAKRS